MKCFWIILCFILNINTIKAWPQSPSQANIATIRQFEINEFYNNLQYTETILNNSSQSSKEELKGLTVNEQKLLLNLIKIKTNRTIEVLNSLKNTEPLQQKNNTVAIQNNYIKSLCFLTMGFNDSAWNYCQKNDRNFNNNINDDLYFEQCLVSAGALLKKGQANKANKYYEKAVQNFNLAPSPYKKASLEALLADIFFQQRLFKQAKQHLEASLNIFREKNNRNGIANCNLTFGNIYYMEINDDSALFHYNKALKQFETIGDFSKIAICESNLSRIYLEKGEHRNALAFAKKALATIKPGNYPLIEAGTYQQIGDIYGELNKIKDAIGYIKTSLAIARKLDNKTIIRDCLKSLSELYFQKQQADSAYQYLLSAYRLKDSILSVNFNQQLADWESKYEHEKMKQKVELLNLRQKKDNFKIKEQKQQLTKQTFTIISMLIIATLALILLYFFNSRKKLKEKLKELALIKSVEEAECNRIAIDLHDNLGSGLSKIKFLSESRLLNESNIINDKNTLQNISEITSKIIDHIKDLIWVLNPENTNLESLIARIREYCTEYIEDTNINLQYNIMKNIPEVTLRKEWNKNILMIVKESLQNIIKHSKANTLFINISGNEDDFCIQFIDDGIGFEENRIKVGNGLKKIKERAKTIGMKATIISSSQGTETIIKGPINKY